MDESVEDKFAKFISQFSDIPLAEYDEVLSILQGELEVLISCREEERVSR